VFGHSVMIKMRIINRKKNKCKLNLWVRHNQIPSSVVSALLRESVRELMDLNELIIRQKHSKLALQISKRMQIIQYLNIV